MTKKEQKIFLDDVRNNLKENGITIGFFLDKIKMSRTHWFFLKNGERELTEEKSRAIISFLKDRLMYQTE